MILKHSFITLTHYEDGSPAIFRVDRIREAKPDVDGGGTVISYANGKEYRVKEHYRLPDEGR